MTSSNDKGSPICPRCDRSRVDATYAVRTPGGEQRVCLPCALKDSGLLARSMKIALVVGSFLVVLNQGDLLLSGTFPAALYWKVPLTYAVPFSVATYSALANAKRRA